MNKEQKKTRDTYLWLGVGLWVVSWILGRLDTMEALAGNIIFGIIGAILLVYGSIIWMRMKNRSWRWALLVIVGPFSFLVFANLRDRSLPSEFQAK